MMSQVSSTLVLKRIKNKEDMINLLVELGEIDCDFNGENGDEYLWEAAEDFKTNAEYLANEAVSMVNTIDVEKCTSEFAKLWLKHDMYYDEIETQVKYDKTADIYAVSIVAKYDS